MRIALNEIDHSEDMSMNYLTMDVLKNIMENTEDLNQFADQVTDQIREMIGCKTAVLMRHFSSSKGETNQLVSICPKAQLKNISEVFFDNLANQMDKETDFILLE